MVDARAHKEIREIGDRHADAEVVKSPEIHCRCCSSYVYPNGWRTVHVPETRTCMWEGKWGAKREATTPTDSRVITDHGTRLALSSLTLEIGRDPVRSGRYGRN